MEYRNGENSPAQFPPVIYLFLILNSVYFTLPYIFTFQYSVHFCTDDVKLHCSICQDAAAQDCGNQDTGQHVSKVPKKPKFCFHKSLP